MKSVDLDIQPGNHGIMYNGIEIIYIQSGLQNVDVSYNSLSEVIWTPCSWQDL